MGCDGNPGGDEEVVTGEEWVASRGLVYHGPLFCCRVEGLMSEATVRRGVAR